MTASMEFQRGDEPVRVTLQALGDDRYQVHIGDAVHQITAHPLADGRVRFAVGGETFTAASVSVSVRSGGGVPARQVRVDGQTWLLQPADRSASGGSAGTGVLEAPMTGTLLSVDVAVGDAVAAGDTVAVLTAMKMEHKLIADIDGTVAEVAAEAGTTIDQGALIVRIEAAEVGA